MKREILFLLVLGIIVFMYCAGCGETVRGVSKDAHRVGKGVRTIFIAEE